jgi:hypothetical protein
LIHQQLRFQNENQRNTDGSRKEVKSKREKGKMSNYQLTVESVSNKKGKRINHKPLKF